MTKRGQEIYENNPHGTGTIISADWTSYRQLDDAVNMYWMLRKSILTSRGWLNNG